MKKLMYFILAGIFLTLLILFWPPKNPSSTTQSSALATSQNKQGSSPSDSGANSGINTASNNIDDASLDHSNSKKLSPEELEKLGWLEGRVVDPSDEGIKDAKVNTLALKRLIGITDFYTDQKGYFKFPKPPDTPFYINVTAKGYSGRSLRFPLDDPGLNNTIQLFPGGDLELFVKDESDQPVTGATVSSRLIGEHQTDADGFVQLHGLPDPAVLTIRAPGFNELAESFPLGKGVQTVTLLRHGSFFGRVVDDEENIPIEVFSIRVLESYFQSVTYDFKDSDGQFEIHELPREELQFFISAPGFLPKSITPDTLAPKEKGTPVEIRLSNEGFYFEGRILDEQGHPIGNAVVTAFIGESIASGKYQRAVFPQKKDSQWQLAPFGWISYVEATSQAGGEYRVGPLPREHFLSLFAKAERFAPKFISQAQTLMSDKRQTLDMVLSPFGILNARVGQEDYPGVRRLWIKFENNERATYELHPGQKNILIEDMYPGKTEINLADFRAQTGSPYSIILVPDMKTVQIKAGEKHDLEIGIIDSVSLAGHVYMDGQPMAEKRVIIVGKKSANRRIDLITDAQGYFKIRGLKPGTYEIMTNGDLKSIHFGAKNRRTITLKADRLDAVFEFESLGKVFGRVLNEESGTSISMKISFRMNSNAGMTTYLGTTLGDDGSFEFPNVPVGMFTLTKDRGYPKPSTLLASDVQMPEDGSDLDLGELGGDQGRFRLALKAPATFPKTVVSFYHRKNESGSSRTLARLSYERPHELVQELPLETIMIQPSVRAGFRVHPKELSVTLEEGVEPSASFELVPVTFFEVNANHQEALRFASATLIQESTQAVFQIPYFEFTNDLRYPEDPPYLSMFRHQVTAKQLPEGWWQIHIVNQEGLTAKRRVQLLPGSPITLMLNTDDFE